MRWIALAVIAVLPLQWYVVASTPLGTGRLHQLALLTFAGLVLVRSRFPAHIPVLRAALPFLLANVYMLTIWAAVDLYHGKLPFGPVQQWLYLTVFVAVGSYIYQAARSQNMQVMDLLRWSAAAACVALVASLSFSMTVNGVNPVAVLGQTVAAADPEILQRQLYRSSFTGFGYEDDTVRGNLRHEIFGAVLLAMYISSWAARLRPLATARQRLVYQASMVVGALLLVLSLSRSILIAACIWPLLVFLRSALSQRLTTRQLAAAFVTVGLITLASVSGFGLVLWNRFTQETSSYEARGRLLDSAFDNIAEHFFTGGVNTVGESSHNFVLDAWLRGGLFVALPAAAVLATVVLAFLILVARIHREPEWMLPITAALALPLVRMGTSGGGLIPPVEWVTLGLIAGALALRREGSLAANRGRQLTVSDAA